MKKNIYILLLFSIFTNIYVQGQNTNNFWYFGLNAGVYFDSSGIHSMSGNIFAAEGTASISDGCGLLFYTDGDTVWNKNQMMMVNGFDIGGRCSAFQRSSGTQAALIVRQPACDSIFYIFTTDCIEDSLSEGLRYSIVNMNLNNGTGEVILKNQLLFTVSEEKITAAKHANGCDIWIVSHEYGTNNFYTYLLTSSGLNTSPVISSVGQIHNSPNPTYFNARGYLKASPNGQKLINVNLDGVYSWADTLLPELFDFNTSNGVVTSDFVFPQDTDYWWPSYSSWSIPFYGASFSPDNSKLYLSSGFYGPNLQQYDLNAGSPSDIVASKILLSTPYPFSSSPVNIPTSLVNAPDGKIYVSQRWKNYLGVINNPDSAGQACNYVDSAFALASGTSNDWGGLPNFFEDYINPKLVQANFSFAQSSASNTIIFTNSSIAANSYVWYFGDGTSSTNQSPLHVYPDTGWYTVSLFAIDNSCDVDRICKTLYISRNSSDGTTEISELNSNVQFSVYPSPFNQELRFQSSGNDKTELILYDLLSRKIFNEKFIKSITVNTCNFPKGIYFFELKNDNRMLKIGKVIKE